MAGSWPLSISLRGAPPMIETCHRLGGAVGPSTQVAIKWLPSGYHPDGMAAKPAGRVSEWISPLSICRRLRPVLSANARYLPSGEMAAPRTGFSSELAVRRRCLIAADVIGPDWRRGRAMINPRSTPDSRTAIVSGIQKRPPPLTGTGWDTTVGAAPF